MIYKLIFFFFLFHLSLQTKLKLEIRPRSLSQNWFFRQVSNSSSQWFPAGVPGSIHLDLMRNELIPDPFYRDNEAKVQWVETVDWEYQTKFDVSKELFLSRVVELRFQGLDTHAMVYLNDRLILKANNFFRSWIVNVKNTLKPGSNSLRIYFKSAVNYDKEMEQSFYPTVVPADNPNRTPFSRKPRYHYGWDWGPRLVTCGIHKPILLVGYDRGKIRNFNIETLQINKNETNTLKNTAQIRVEAFIESVDTEKMMNYKLTWWETPYKKQILDMGHLLASANSSIFHYDQNFTLHNIELWWSRGLGEAHLYEFGLEIYDAFNKICDESRRMVGFRTVKLLQIDDSDKKGRGFLLNLNGIDVFIKGANYIPPDSFITRVTTKKYDQLIFDILGANYNAIRIWGGGYFESPYFYDKCDENGILILQDFMFACEMYPGTIDYMSNYQEEFIENVLNLKTHPSIVLWIGNNEVNEAWHNWGIKDDLTEENKNLVWNWYLSIFEDLFPKLISQYDSQRPYWPSSPLYGYYHPESFRFGDSHYWSVWAGAQPIENYRNNVGRFMTEYGMQGILDINSIKLFTISEDRHLNSSTIKMHEKHTKGFPYLNQYINETCGILPDDFEDFVYLSQIMQAYAIELAVTSHRSQKPYCMGTLYWQLNDAWPSLSWSSVDHYGHWKALHYAARRFNQDLILLGRENKETGLLDIQVLSDNQLDKKVDLEVYKYSTKGDKLETKIWKDYYLKGLSNELLATFDIAEQNKSKIFFYFKVIEKETQKIGENFYFMKEPKKLELVTGKNVNLVYIDKAIRVWSNVFVKGLYIYCDKTYLKFENNYFDLLPNQKVDVKILNFKEIANEFDENQIKIKSYNEILEIYV